MQKFTIIWLDVNSSDPMNSFRSKLDDAKTFTNPSECIDYIQSHPYEQIYLIVSGLFAKEVVPKVYTSLNLIEIFLFCGSIVSYAEWALDYCEKMLIFDHENDLLNDYGKIWK